jgi:hypothetical protein
MSEVRSTATGASAREVWLFALGVVALIAIEMVVARGGAALSAPLWLDEIHTALLAERQDLIGSMRSLAAGSDFNPPTLYLIYRLVGTITGGLTDVSMRLVAMASVVATLPIVYALLRDTFDRDAASIGALAMWAQPVVASVAFDARFYGPWLLGTTMLLAAVRRAISAPATPLSRVGLAVASAFVCTIHYFGIVSWAAALGVGWLCLRRPVRDRIRLLLPAVVGPIALVACVPFYLGQRAALTIPTWIPRASVTDHALLLAFLLVPTVTLIALIGWGATKLLQPLRPGALSSTPLPRIGAGVWLLLGQAAVPLALAAFSLLVQPSTQPRYWIVGSLFTGAVVAYAAARSQIMLRWASGIAIMIVGGSLVSGQGDAGRARAARLREDIQLARRAVSDGSLLVIRRRHTLYPLLRAEPDLAPAVALLDGSGLPGDEQRLAQVERDVARVHQRLYGFPRLVTPGELAQRPAFYLLELGETRVPATSEFPLDDIARVAPRLFRLTKR